MQQPLPQLHLRALGVVVLQTRAHLLPHLVHGLTLADLLGEGIIQRVGRDGADLVDVAAEFRVLARQLRRVILGREGHVDRHVVAGVLADELLFKAGDERAAAEDQRLLFGRAAGKLLAVRETGVIEDQLVAILRRAVKDGGAPLALLLQAHQLSGDLLVRNVHMLESGPQAAVFEFHGDSPCLLFIEPGRTGRRAPECL